MVLHRGWRVYARAAGLLGLVVVCWYSPWLLRLVGRQYLPGDWVGSAMAAVLLVGNFRRIWALRQPFEIRIDATGITRTCAGRTVRFAWQELAHVSVELRPDAGWRPVPRLLTVWSSAETGDHGLAPDVRRDALRGYRVVDLDDVREPWAEVEAALRRHAGGRCVEASA